MRKWTNEQIEYLKKIYKNKSDQQITDLINKKFNTNYTKSAINSKKGDLHLISNAHFFKYSQEMIDYIIRNHKGKSLKELANDVNKKFNLNVNEDSIGNLKSRLRLKYGIILESARNDGCFKKGNKPINKGKKWDEYMSNEGQANSRKTCFKKGNKPSNAVPIGTEKMRYSGSHPNDPGYVYVKVTDGKGNKNWIPKQHLIYEQHYGKIPEKSKVIFADGNRFNFDIDNLILLSNSEELVMNRNKLFSTDKDITNTGAILAKLIDKGNKLKNEQKRK